MIKRVDDNIPGSVTEQENKNPAAGGASFSPVRGSFYVPGEHDARLKPYGTVEMGGYSPQLQPGLPPPDKSSKPEPMQGYSTSMSAPEVRKQLVPYETAQFGSHSHKAMPDINRHLWEKSANPAWNEGPIGRLAIRLFSRGLMGAAFFTVGGLMTRKLMIDAPYVPTKPMSQMANPLQVIAKSIDVVVGAPIKKVVSAVAGKAAGEEAVFFRQTRYNPATSQNGRSLGDEVVGVTFDFFCASVGDAWGRDIAAMIDPNAKKSWIDEKGNFSPSKAVKAMVDSTVRYVTYHGGEDWAVALPYVYFMKGQRAVLNKLDKGFNNDFDRQLNGSSFRVREGEMVGNYNRTGIVDLQSRFTFYNIGTLMYREAYSYLGSVFAGKKASLFGAPDEQKAHKDVFDHLADIGKWTARSAVKGAIIMTPSVPFFWVTRTPQTKHRALFIDPDRGVLGYSASGGHFDFIHANTGSMLQDGSPAKPLYLRHDFSKDPRKPMVLSEPLENGRLAASLDFSTGKVFDSYEHEFGPVDKLLNRAGKVNFDTAHALDKPGEAAFKKLGRFGDDVLSSFGIKDTTRLTRPFVYAAYSYTPYMYAKSEFANLWDNGKMDLAAERLVNGATRLDWGEFKRGVNEVYRTVMLKPLSDPAREAEAQRRMMLDTSPPDDFDATQAEQVATRHNMEPNWRERIISAPRETVSHQQKVRGGDGASLGDYRRPRTNPQPEKLAEREALRKALEELHPPTNSIN